MVQIRHIREKLKDTGEKPKFIKTIWGWVILSNRKFSYKYRQSLLLKHLIGGIATLILLASTYYLIAALYDNNFYTMLENLFGRVRTFNTRL